MKNIVNVSLAIFSIIMVLILLEAVIGAFSCGQRIIATERIDPEVVDRRGCRPDPVFNRAHVPNYSFTYPASDGQEEDILVGYNAKGLNDIERGYAKPAHTCRILILGDSFVEAIQVERDDNFCRLLEGRLNSSMPGENFEIINAGISGYSPLLEYLFLEREGMKYDPDIVVLCFFMNDVFEDREYKDMARFDKNGLPISVHYEGFDKFKQLKGWKRLERSVCNKIKSFLKRSRFYTFLKKRTYVLLKRLGLKKSSVNRNQFLVLREQEYPEEKGMWADTEKYIHAIDELAEKNDSRMLLVSIPLEAELVNDPKDAAFKSYFKNKPYSKRVRENLLRICRGRNIYFIDLLEEFRDAEAEGLYFRDDGHFNANGHRMTADILHRHLRMFYVKDPN